MMRHWFRELPHLLRFLAINASFGIVIGGVAATALLWWDIGGLGTLFANSRHPFIAGLLLYGGFAVTFGSAAMGTAVLFLSEEGEDG